jgi:hypothetical protein
LFRSGLDVPRFNGSLDCLDPTLVVSDIVGGFVAQLLFLFCVPSAARKSGRAPGRGKPESCTDKSNGLGDEKQDSEK